tara:strand:- start:109 stop:498 length:390 start_codon:yes stop_codon:yes gene_type:complete
MRWKTILKKDEDERTDLQIELEKLVEDWGQDKMFDDFDGLDGNLEFDERLSMSVDFEDAYEGDEDLTNEEKLEDDEAHFRIEFYLPNSGKELALCDYTYEAGWRVVEFTPEKFSIDELEAALKSDVWRS